MKRILAIVLCLVLSLGCLVGCKWKEEEKTEANQEIFGINEKGDTVPLAETEVVKEINIKIQNLANEVGSSRYDEEKVSGSISGLKSDVKSLRGKDKEFEGEFGVIKGDLDAVNKGLNGLKENVEDLQINDEELEETDIKLGRAIGDIWRALPGIISKFINDFYSKKIKPELTTLKFKVMGIEKYLGILTNRLADDEKDIEQNTADIAENRRDIEANKGNISANTTNAETLRQSILYLDGVLSAHSYYITDNSNRITNLEGKVKTLEDSDFQSKITTLQGQINELEIKVNGIIGGEDNDN